MKYNEKCPSLYWNDENRRSPFAEKQTKILYKSSPPINALSKSHPPPQKKYDEKSSTSRFLHNKSLPSQKFPPKDVNPPCYCNLGILWGGRTLSSFHFSFSVTGISQLSEGEQFSAVTFGRGINFFGGGLGGRFSFHIFHEGEVYFSYLFPCIFGTFPRKIIGRDQRSQCYRWKLSILVDSALIAAERSEELALSPVPTKFR